MTDPRWTVDREPRGTAARLRDGDVTVASFYTNAGRDIAQRIADWLNRETEDWTALLVLRARHDTEVEGVRDADTLHQAREVLAADAHSDHEMLHHLRRVLSPPTTESEEAR